MPRVSNLSENRQWALLIVALGLLDISLTFDNVWPTPLVKWTGGVSIELAVLVILLAVLTRGARRVRRGVLSLVAAIWVLLIIGHYADVTVPAVFGRPINLYWDSRHLRAVGEMLATAASLWIVLLAIALIVLVPLLIYWPARWAIGRVAVAMTDRTTRRVLTAGAVVVIPLFVVYPRNPDMPSAAPPFPAPASAAYAKQVALVAREVMRAGSRQLPPSPPMTANLSRVSDADVFLIFIESYGAVTYDNPTISSGLASSRDSFERDVAESGRKVVSGFVESPTFGGSSWLAHITLLSGIDVRDEDTNIMLMASKRETLVSTFARRGFRTVALMPGLQQVWPEGRFYGFDAVYRGNELEYKGPDFGWWSVPDQFSLARVDALELQRQPRRPVFVVFPTIMTHAPFSPIAPYQPDWSRMVTAKPYDVPEVLHELDQQPNWIELGRSYIRATAYDLASIGGYLRWRSGRPVVMILIGDHQPPAAVSGEHARWDVPVHIVTDRQDILDRFVVHGFTAGMQPRTRTISHMHELTTMALDAFSTHDLSTGLDEN